VYENSLSTLRFRQKETARKIEYQQLVYPLRQCSITPVGFGQEFLSNGQCNNTGTSPILYWPPFSWFFTCSDDWNDHWGDGTSVILLSLLGMRRKRWKGYHKMASRGISNTFTVIGRNPYLHKGTILKEMHFQRFYCFLFLIYKAIPGIFWSYHVYLADTWDRCLSTH